MQGQAQSALEGQGWSIPPLKPLIHFEKDSSKLFSPSLRISSAYLHGQSYQQSSFFSFWLSQFSKGSWQ